MKLRLTSIRTRISLMTLVPIALVTVLFAVEAKHRANQVAQDLFDRTLLANATTIAENVVATGGDLLDDDLVDVIEAISLDRVFYRVSGPGGAYIAGHATRPRLPEEFREPAETKFADAVFRGEPVRLVAFSFTVSEEPVPGRVIVHVWQTVRERHALLADIVGAVLLRFLVLLAIAGAIIWWGVTRGLRPLTEIGTAVERRGVSDLRPIEREVPMEIASLVGSMNRLFMRLDVSVRSMEGFISNASHQLRTPLAAIKTQAELAQSSEDAEAVDAHLEKLTNMTARTSRLAEQLLNLARVEATETVTEKFDAAEIAREVTAEAVTSALAEGIDLGYDGPRTGVWIKGDAVLLREALRNVVNNALTYCSAGSTVTVSTNEIDHQANITVSDDGPGVPTEHHARLGERFFRVPGTVARGCGLGLTIAGEAILRLGGTMGIGGGPTGGGLSIQFCIPTTAKPVSGADTAARN